jgi:multisubunit Na+/H+ antiporter MnhG subunit
MDFVTVAQNLGVPVACMAVMSYALFRVGKFMASGIILAFNQLLIPLVHGHLAFLKILEDSVKGLKVASEKQADVNQQILDKLDEIHTLRQTAK